jgi:hypothetical protein
MKNNRSQFYRVGNMVLTNMTAREVQKLDRIMNPVVNTETSSSITLAEYIEKYNPAVRRWVSKKGTEMVAAAVLHDVIDEPFCDEIEQPALYADRKVLRLK